MGACPDYLENCCCDEDGNDWAFKVGPIVNDPKDEEKKEKDKLSNNSTGVAKEYSERDLDSDISKTSSFNSSNEDHFEINIRYGHQEIKFKVKKKYTVSKVITKFIEAENPQDVQGRLMQEGVPLKFTKTLGELGISENDTLDLV